MIRRNWSCWLHLLLLAPLIGTAPGQSLSLFALLLALLIVGMTLPAVLHAHQRHNRDRWNRA